MSGIAPNGTLVSDYDPTGIGAYVYASITKANANAAGFAVEIVLGDEVDGSILYPSAPNKNTSTANTGDLISSTTPLPGRWICAGYAGVLNAASHTDFATLWMRVS